jgi:hypothetical protein
MMALARGILIPEHARPSTFPRLRVVVQAVSGTNLTVYGGKRARASQKRMHVNKHESVR